MEKVYEEKIELEEFDFENWVDGKIIEGEECFSECDIPIFQYDNYCNYIQLVKHNKNSDYNAVPLLDEEGNEIVTRTFILDYNEDEKLVEIYEIN